MSKELRHGLLRRIPFRRSDRHLVAAPLYHATGSGFATLATTLGSTVHVMEKYDPEAFLRIVDRAKITTTALVPPMIRAIVDLPAETRRCYDVSSLRIVISTGSALNEGLERAAFEPLGDVIYDLYGSTEMAYVTVATPADKRACPGTIGLPVPGVEVLLLDEELAGYKVPRHFERVASLPRNPTGKILKNELRSRVTRRR